ncbi:MAG: hypothetical protein ACP5UU_05560 [Thermoprotei archaeon]
MGSPWRSVKARWKSISINLFFIALNLFILRHALFMGAFNSDDIGLAYANGLQRLASAWNYQNLGAVNIPAGVFFMYSALSSAVGVVTAEKLFYFWPLFIAPLSAYYLSRSVGLSELRSFTLSFLYELSPWFGPLFSAGSGFAWLLAFVPMVFYFALKALKEDRPSHYLALAVVLWFTISFTLIYFVLCFFLLVPLLVAAAFRYGKRFFRPAIKMLGASGLALLANAYVFMGYWRPARDLARQSPSNPAAILGLYQSKWAQSLRLWLVLLLLLSFLCLLLILRSDEKTHRSFALATMGTEAFFTGIYLAIPSKLVEYLYVFIPIFTVYANIFEYLIVGWDYTLSMVAVAMLVLQRERSLRPETGAAVSVSHPSVARLGRNYGRKRLALFVIILVLLSSAFFISIGLGSEANFLEGNLYFEEGRIPQFYFKIVKYLDAQNVSYFLSPHTLIVPLNPDSPAGLNPILLGQDDIPGFLGADPQLLEVLNGICQNQSTTTAEEMSLMGIKYVVVVNWGPSSWPFANESASIGGWGDGYFPQGTPASYERILGSWPGLVPVYRGSNFTVFENRYYLSPAIYVSDTLYEEINGTGPLKATLVFMNRTPIGPNLVRNPSLEGMTDWSLGGTNATFLKNGTVELMPGSRGAWLTQSVVLKPGQWYEESLYVRTNPGYDGFPPNGFSRNFLGLWWNKGTGFKGTPGDYIGGYFNGNFTGYATFVFQAPNYTGPVPAVLGLSYEPPLGKEPIFTTYTNVTLIPINGSNIYTKVVVPVSVKQLDPTRIEVLNASNYGPGYVQLDTSYSRNWVAVLSNGTVEEGQSGLFGLETFQVSSGERITLIYYRGQSTYYYQLLIAWSLLALIFVAYLVEQLRGK